MDFTRRFEFALSFYFDTFWDRRLPAGEFEPQLLAEIETRDYFILVMTPYSIRDDSWCRKEILHAQELNKPIILAKLFDSGTEYEKELSDKYTYCDFTVDFEQGFRRVCEMTLGQPFSSWEVYANFNDKDLLDALQRGFVPGLIAKEIIEWILVEKLWFEVEKYSKDKTMLFRGTPRTPTGALRQASGLIKQFAERRDQLGAHIAKQVTETVEPLLKKTYETHDDDHEELGALAYQVIQNVRQILKKNAAGFLAAEDAFLIQSGYFEFDVAEKLRELLNLHARRSRYLY